MAGVLPSKLCINTTTIQRGSSDGIKKRVIPGRHFTQCWAEVVHSYWTHKTKMYKIYPGQAYNTLRYTGLEASHWSTNLDRNWGLALRAMTGAHYLVTNRNFRASKSMRLLHDWALRLSKTLAHTLCRSK